MFLVDSREIDLSHQQKTLFGNSHVTDDVITLDET